MGMCGGWVRMGRGQEGVVPGVVIGCVEDGVWFQCSSSTVWFDINPVEAVSGVWFPDGPSQITWATTLSVLSALLCGEGSSYEGTGYRIQSSSENWAEKYSCYFFAGFALDGVKFLL